MTTIDTQEQSEPFFAAGIFAPVAEEVTAFDLPVTGSIPAPLQGRYLRNGPNPPGAVPAHWFFGDGMLHGVELRDGRACWYRNRWVRTPSLVAGTDWLNDFADAGLDLRIGANTSVIRHAGRILALIETAFPVEVTPTLETVGAYDFGGRLTTAMTAHPKQCPVTGELHFFGYGIVPPYLTYHRVDAAGQLVQSEAITVAGPTMIHDFAITERHVVFMDLPAVLDVDLLLARCMPYRWSDDYGARIGVMPRGGRDTDVRWYEVEPGYAFHTLNAFDHADGVHLSVDVVRYPELWRDDQASILPPAALHRWTVNRRAGTASETALDDRPVEFPSVDPRRLGQLHRYGYAVVDFQSGDGAGVAKYDLRDGRVDVHPFGPDGVPGEAVFVPSDPAAGEDEGWLLCFVHQRDGSASRLAILDATDVTAPPVATISLPSRVPFGFHGSWIADEPS